MVHFILQSLDDTRHFGRYLGELCSPNDIICLDGELGAGKTTLTQCIAHGIGIDPAEYVTSPTFALFHQYRGNLTVNHMDFYRLASSDEVYELGLDEYFSHGGVTIIEWYQRAIDIIPDHYLLITLRWVDENRRTIAASSSSKRWRERLGRLSQRFSK